MSQTQQATSTGGESFAALFEESLKRSEMRSGEVITAEVVRVVQALRKLDLKKSPSIAETVEWVRALTVLGQNTLDAQLAEETLNLVLKYQADIETAREQQKTLFPDSAARQK